MKTTDIIELLPYKEFTKNDFAKKVRTIKPDYSERSIYWLLHKLQEENIIQRVGRDCFVPVEQQKKKMLYTYQQSYELREVVNKIQMEYPLVDFQVWELVQLNEFVNHQIAHNVIFVEVENMLEETIFNMLKEEYPDVLLCPTEDIFYTYKGLDNTIVILKLLSEAPRPLHGTKSACIEKIMVDLFSKKLLGNIIQRSEYQAVYEDAFERYYIDEKKLFRYARRRHLEKDIRDFIKENTNIELKTGEK